MPDDNEKHDDAPRRDDLTPAEAGMKCTNTLPAETVKSYRERIRSRLAEGREKALERREKSRKKSAATRAAAGVTIRSSKKVDLAQDILWVYENIGSEKENRKTAPGMGALNMLDWARTSETTRKEFFKFTLPKALAMQEAREQAKRKNEQQGAGKDGEHVADLPLAGVERLLREFAGEETHGKA